jgi:hypothetical protein
LATATARDELRRHVRAAVAASSSEEEFFARLADAGVRVERRASVRNPGEWIGYKVAVPTHTTASGEPQRVSGGSLANDLTLPKLVSAGPTRTRTDPPHETRYGSPSRNGYRR